MSNQIKSSKICKSCGNDIWDVYGDTLKCSNCLEERPYILRQPTSKITPSQQHKIDKIHEYFLNTFGGKEYGLTLDEIEVLDFNGKVLIKVETGGNVYVSEGATICIGSRGKIDIWTTSFTTNEKLLEQSIK